MLPAAAEDLAARLRDLAAVAPDIELVVLFGSVATGRARARSDVDVAVRGAGPANLDELYRVLAPRIGTARLDLVDLRRASPLLMMEVARRGRLLFERHPGAFRQFQALASRRYCDTAKLRRAQRRAIQAFLARELSA
jgi:predicted nucleotidyltransferase